MGVPGLISYFPLVNYIYLMHTRLLYYTRFLIVSRILSDKCYPVGPQVMVMPLGCHNRRVQGQERDIIYAALSLLVGEMHKVLISESGRRVRLVNQF